DDSTKIFEEILALLFVHRFPTAYMIASRKTNLQTLARIGPAPAAGVLDDIARPRLVQTVNGTGRRLSQGIAPRNDSKRWRPPPKDKTSRQMPPKPRESSRPSKDHISNAPKETSDTPAPGWSVQATEENSSFCTVHDCRTGHNEKVRDQNLA